MTQVSLLQVKQLAGDTKLDRKQVLAWLKDRAQQPSTCEPAPPEKIQSPCKV